MLILAVGRWGTEYYRFQNVDMVIIIIAHAKAHINFNKMVFVLKHFTFLFRFEAVFIFPSWFHWI